MNEKKTRFSVDLSPAAVEVLRLQAKADGRLLKNYLEKILTDRSEKKRGNLDTKK